MASRRQSLKALAESRGCGPPSIRRHVGGEWRATCYPCVDVLYALTRKVAEAGLRACLESMPLKRKGRG